MTKSKPEVSKHVDTIIKDIINGVNTNALIAAKYKVSPESICSQVNRLRRSGIISAVNQALPNNPSSCLCYSYTGLPYVIADPSVGHQRNPRNVLENEPKYECLDEFIYSWPAPERKQA